jgi:hypothetical protein
MWSSMGQHMGQLSREAASAGKVSHGALDCPTDLGRPKVREIRDLTPIVLLSHTIGTRYVGQAAPDLRPSQPGTKTAAVCRRPSIAGKAKCC